MTHTRLIVGFKQLAAHWKQSAKTVYHWNSRGYLDGLPRIDGKPRGRPAVTPEQADAWLAEKRRPAKRNSDPSQLVWRDTSLVLELWAHMEQMSPELAEIMSETFSVYPPWME
jgi:transposase